MGEGAVTAEELCDRNRYALVWELDHQVLARALQPYIWRRSWVAAVYVAANALAVATVAGAWVRSGIDLRDGFPLVCLGMVAGYVLLLPIHEAVHAFAYKRLGAASIHVRYQWRSLSAFCAADRFVVGRRGLVWVCLAPFLAINPPLAVGAYFAPGPWGPLVAGALLLHVGACSGDFGMVNWLWLVGTHDVLSYDDVAGGRTYFVRPIPAITYPSAPPDRNKQVV